MTEHATISPSTFRSTARWVWMIVIGLAILVGSYLFFVRTYTGQYLENSALIGASLEANASQVAEALENLRVISYVSLGAALVAIVIIGLIRKAWQIAAAGVWVLAGATVTTELLKKVLLTRPDLAPIYQDNAHNSFPSGHTTIAMAILVSLLIVVPYRWRGPVMLVTVTWATTIASATITARWHRFSDTVSANAVVLIFGAIALIWLARQGLLVVEQGRAYPLRTTLYVILTVTAVAAMAVGLLLAFMMVHNYGIGSAAATAASDAVADTNFTRNLFLAAQSLALGLSTSSVLWFWATMHRLESSHASVSSSLPSA